MDADTRRTGEELIKNGKRMKILLKQKGLERFLTPMCNWIEDSRNAWEFESASEAIKYCVSTQSWNVDLVLRFQEFGKAVEFPLEDASFAIPNIPPLRPVPLTRHWHRQSEFTD